MAEFDEGNALADEFQRLTSSSSSSDESADSIIEKVLARTTSHTGLQAFLKKNMLPILKYSKRKGTAVD